MNAAIHARDPNFRLWTDADARELGHGLEAGRPGPSAILGDFDGDLIADVALLGRSGADQVVLAILSNHGNIAAVEVAWRKVRIGKGENRTRGDPRRFAPVSLALAPRGQLNPFCWTTQRRHAPLDGVGIVGPGGVRFDYVFTWDPMRSKGTFRLVAPLP